MFCATCKHPGAHAEVAAPDGMPARCTQCPQCQAEQPRESNTAE
jgi:hypothetical protein